MHHWPRHAASQHLRERCPRLAARRQLELHRLTHPQPPNAAPAQVMVAHAPLGQQPPTRPTHQGCIPARSPMDYQRVPRQQGPQEGVGVDATQQQEPAGVAVATAPASETAGYWSGWVPRQPLELWSSGQTPPAFLRVCCRSTWRMPRLQLNKRVSSVSTTETHRAGESGRAAHQSGRSPKPPKRRSAQPSKGPLSLTAAAAGPRTSQRVWSRTPPNGVTLVSSAER